MTPATPPWGLTEHDLDGGNYPDGWPCACGPDCRAPGGCMSGAARPGFTYAGTYDAGNPETARDRCDGCGQEAMCTAGYACPATCQGACGTDGCTAVIVLCGRCRQPGGCTDPGTDAGKALVPRPPWEFATNGRVGRAQP